MLKWSSTSAIFPPYAMRLRDGCSGSAAGGALASAVHLKGMQHEASEQT